MAAALGARAYLARSGRFRSRVIGIIPARFASTRFQGKPLVHILGKPMIQVFLKSPSFFTVLLTYITVRIEHKLQDEYSSIMDYS